jgi:hypothetical protein
MFKKYSDAIAYTKARANVEVLKLQLEAAVCMYTARLEELASRVNAGLPTVKIAYSVVVAEDKVIQVTDKLEDASYRLAALRSKSLGNRRHPIYIL